MRAGLVFLVAGYVLSQFYRAFLAVLTPILGAEIGATPGDLAVSSGIWFLIFAVMQVPVGEALDRIGPRLTASVLLGLGGGGGALVFALAGGPWAVHVAMALIGIGCSPVLMASYYIFARQFPAAQFATLAAVRRRTSPTNTDSMRLSRSMDARDQGSTPTPGSSTILAPSFASAARRCRSVSAASADPRVPESPPRVRPTRLNQLHRQLSKGRSPP
jgi:hypothetical protein